MPDLKYDVLGIGNAIVDVIARAEDDFLVKQGMHKGGMALIDEPRAQAIYQAMGKAVEKSGGSAANTIVGVANLGTHSWGPEQLPRARRPDATGREDRGCRPCLRRGPRRRIRRQHLRSRLQGYRAYSAGSVESGWHAGQAQAPAPARLVV